MNYIISFVFIVFSSTIYANDVLKESLVKEITEGIGTYSFKLNEDVNLNTVNVDGQEVPLINYFIEIPFSEEFEKFTVKNKKYLQLLQNLDGIEGWENDMIFISVNKRTNKINSLEKVTYLKKATLELFTDETYNPIFAGNTMLENLERNLLNLGYEEIRNEDINIPNFETFGKRLLFKKENLIVLLRTVLPREVEGVNMGGFITVITSEKFYEEYKDFYK